MGFFSKVGGFFKKVGKGIKKGAEAVVDAVTTVVNGVVETLDSILGWVLSAVSFVVDLVLSIPYVGRALRWLWNGVLTVFWGLVGIVDFLFALIGILPEKKLRVCTLVLRDASGPVANTGDVVKELQNAVEIYHDEANVRIVPSAPFQYDSGFAGEEKPDASWVDVSKDVNDADVLDVDCGGGAAGEDLGLTGSRFELLAATQCFYGNWRRLVGYGAPVVIFVVRSGRGKLGCSIGPLTDYVTVTGSNPICIAHELGHACDLWHVDGTNNLMFQRCGQRDLSRWQVALLRNSRHVTYF